MSRVMCIFSKYCQPVYVDTVQRVDLNPHLACHMYYAVQELCLPDVPAMMTLLDERPSGKLCVSYQKQSVVDAVDEIKATMQRIPNLDIAKVSGNNHQQLYAHTPVYMYICNV